MSEEFTLSRRKALAALGTIGVTSAGAGLGTTAYFSDTETFEGNTLTAGELDLKIDWQQTYDGPAGVVPINAYPDEDGDGWQSLGGTVYAGPGAGDTSAMDIPNPCGNLESGSQLPDGVFDRPDGTEQDHLIELADVKPGDWGEVTFSIHLCDNPGYVWVDGVLDANDEMGMNEPERAVDETSGEGNGELADAIRAQAWYDLDCDNVRDDGPDSDGDDMDDDTAEVIFAQGTLKEVLAQLADGGHLLDNRVYASGVALEDSIGSGDGTSDGTCSYLGKVETDGDGDDFQATGENVTGVTKVSADVYDVTFSVDGSDVTVSLTVTERKDDGEIVEFTYDFPEGYGACAVNVKGGARDGGVVRTTYDSCTDTDSGLRPPLNSGGQQAAVSNVEFSYCPTGDGGVTPGGEPNEVCIPNSHTRCIGFEWWLPAETGNEVQSDSVSFDLGFYTQQCRHNDGTRQAPE